MSYSFEQVIKHIPDMTFREANRLARALIDQMSGRVDYTSAAEGDIDEASVAESLIGAAEDLVRNDAFAAEQAKAASK